MINLKNYTTVVTPAKSIEAIEKLLMGFGATHINKMIESGKVRAISFVVVVDAVPIAFRLPGDIQSLYRWLKKKKPNSKDSTLLDQAERIVWKHQAEWLHIQLTGMELQQIAKLQALMPYAYDPATNKTFFETLRENDFRLLGPAK